LVNAKVELSRGGIFCRSGSWRGPQALYDRRAQRARPPRTPPRL